MTSYIFITAEAVSAVILAILFYGAVFEGFWKNRKSRFFAQCIVATLVGVVCDILTWIGAGHGDTGSFRALTIALSFSFSPVVAAAFVQFSAEFIGEKCHVSRKFLQGVKVALLLSAILMMTSMLWGGLFVFEPNGDISPRLWLAFSYVTPFAFLYIFVLTLRHSRMLGSHDVVALITYCLIPIAGIVSGNLSLTFDFTYVALSIAIVLMFVMLLFGHASEQNRKLVAQKEELIKSRTFAGYFLGTFMSAYYVDVSKNRFSIYRQRDYMKDAFNQVEDYVATAKNYIENGMLEEDRPKLAWIADLEQVKEWIGKSEQYSAVFTDISYNPPRHIKIVILPGEDADHVAIGFTDVEAEFLMEESKKQQIEELLKKTQAVSSANTETIRMALKMLQSSTPLQDLRPILNIARDRFAAVNCFVFSFNGDYSAAIAKNNWHVGISMAHVDVEAELPLEPESTLVQHLKAGEIVRLPSSEYTKLWTKAGLPVGKPLVERKLSVVSVPVMIAGSLWGCLSMTVPEKNIPVDLALTGFSRLGGILGSMIERQIMYGKLTAALEESRSAAKAKSTFLSIMSHEIRTPLNAVIGFAEFLQNDNLEPNERNQYLDGILRSSNALLALINDILDISKIEAGKMDVAGGSVDFRKLLEEVRAIFDFRVLQKGFAIRVAVDKNIPCLALREERMRQILINLVGNAVKFTEKGAVDIMVSYHEGTLRIRVADTGVGISVERLGSIFDPFQQDSGVRGGKVYQGTGLGLPICKRLVESVGGTIAVESRKGEGSVFTVTIPNVPEAHVEPQVSEPSAVSKPRPAIPPEEIQVVLVDDVPVNLLVLRKFVEKVGIPQDNIKSFSGAPAALEALRELVLKTPGGVRDIFVLTDMWMPEMTGEDLAKAISSDDSLRGIWVFAVTADSDPSGSFDMSNFAGVISKPITGAKVAAVFSENGTGSR